MPCENATVAGRQSTSGLKDTIAADAVTIFCNLSDFAEPVVYFPRNGGSRAINAVVVRDPIDNVSEDNAQTSLPIWEVHVANDTIKGISSTELNIGGDMISFSPRDGKRPEKKSVLQLLFQDNGMLVLQCR